MKCLLICHNQTYLVNLFKYYQVFFKFGDANMAKLTGVGGIVAVPMIGFARQKAISTDPAKKTRTWALRQYVVPSETKESLPARLALARAAQSAYGKTFEEVVAAVVSACSGKDYGGAVKASRLREMAHASATANIARMEIRARAL